MVDRPDIQRPDVQRLVGDVARLGTIASVDHRKARCTVQVADLVTGAIPWLTHRAGATALWSPPSVGEQVLLICPEGDAVAGVALRGVYSDANPAPASSPTLELMRFADGAMISYDSHAHALSVVLPEGGAAHIVAPGGLTIDGPVTVTGTITASDDIVGKGISLHDHVHDQVKAGADKSGKPA